MSFGNWVGKTGVWGREDADGLVRRPMTVIRLSDQCEGGDGLHKPKLGRFPRRDQYLVLF